MRLPEPVPGLVIRYAYLWFSEYAAGREEGAKDRPCAIIAAIRSDEDGEMRVLVLPVSHALPLRSQEVVEIPTAVKQRLGLDGERSWVVLTEWNEFTWPGPDLRRAPGGEPSSVAYGVLPPRFFASLRDRFLELAGVSAARRVSRTE